MSATHIWCSDGTQLLPVTEIGRHALGMLNQTLHKYVCAHCGWFGGGGRRKCDAKQRYMMIAEGCQDMGQT